ncbi:Type 2A phosphatase-associated protein 42 [Coemansia pectinata]|uniref:Type 2A phosphatase-associated protein 42 n=1 Tax=Coemansia pectinata TaxID=1052879 RepID=A0A9W8LCJ0_9FUNG|nr:Type 2A phosphatase-associated protein 42 [Coemansia pectinata]
MDSDTSAPESSLRVNFARAQRQLQAINKSELASSSVEYQSQAQALVKLLKTCAAQVDQLSLFSSNETPDDYSTSELRLLLVSAYLGEALQKLSASKNRVAILEEAAVSYKRFLLTAQLLGIVDKHAVDVEKLSTTESNSSSGRPTASDPGRDRMQKIERFKKMRALQLSIAELEAKLAGGDAAAGGKSNKEEESDDDLDEVERDHVVKLIELKIYQVVDDLDILKGEMKMAQQMEEMKRRSAGNGEADNRSRSGPGALPDEVSDGEWRLDSQTYHQIDTRTGRPSVRPVFNSKGQPTQPFVLTNNRQAIKDSVFRPGWALPTMTIDEYLKQEEERGGIISGGGKEPDAKPEIDDNDHEALDAETMKKREWDEFTDNNPKGAGNRGGNRG